MEYQEVFFIVMILLSGFVIFMDDKKFERKNK